MGKYIKGGVATLQSGGTPSTASKKKQVKTKKVKSVSDSPQRNVRFDCSPPEKEHVKYVTTPFSSCAKKEKKKVIKKGKEIGKKKKLSFGENDGQLTETKRAKKRKIINNESKTQENGDVRETSNVVVKEPKQSKALVMKKRKEIGKKKKLPLGENDGQLTETKRAKKRKIITDESKTQENGDMSKTSDVVVKKPKQSKALVIKKRNEIGNKKKLPFGENDGQLTETKRAKKRKIITDKSKTQENIDVGETSDVVKKQEQLKARKDINIIDSSDFKSRLCQNTVEILDGVKDSDVKNNADEKKNTIFVGNLPLTYNHKKVVKLFNKFGEIESARLRCVPVSSVNISKRVSAITKKFHPNRNSAVAYIVFKSKESVDKAVSENGMVVDDHHLRIDYASPKEKDLNKSVFVGGLPFDVEDDELWDAFKNCGEIEGVRIVRDSTTGIGKGFGYVNFKSNASVELALNLNGQEIKKRKINVQRCMTKKKRNKKSNKVIATTYLSNKQKGKKKKYKNKIENSKLEKDSSLKDFQGKKAEQKKKKKKNKKTKDESRKRKIKLVLNSVPKKLNKAKKPS